jgi:hypothetical protein
MSPSFNSQSYGNAELTGTAPLLPPPLLTVLGPNSSTGRHDQDDGATFDGDGGVGSVLGTGIRKPIAKAAQELPDSPRSNRRPPILPFFQHLHAVHVVHSISERTEEVRVLPYSSACPTRSNGRRPGLELGDIEPGW